MEEKATEEKTVETKNLSNTKFRKTTKGHGLWQKKLKKKTRILRKTKKRKIEQEEIRGKKKHVRI